jgi:glycosyltransferase involved in cell wall biosynthesis
VVATNVGGLPEIVRHDHTGLLVPPRDPGALAHALETLLADPGRARRLAQTAAERMDQFTIAAVAARFADLYEQLVRDAPPEPASRVAAQT